MAMTPLWLALGLPQLPLEVHCSPHSPEAVVEQGRILARDPAAADAGVTPGQPVAAARALAPSLQVYSRRPDMEQRALAALACMAGAFTPRVCLAPQALLLEIASCLRLFGGRESIVRALTQAVRAQGYTPRLAAAPTPQGALWLMTAAPDTFIETRESLAPALDPLPLAILDLPTSALTRLASFGLHRLGEVRRLPGAPLARRVGQETVAALARAYGELADPRADFVFPARFAQGLALPAPTDSAAALAFGARRLLSALAGWLHARQAGLRECQLQLLHHQGTVTVLPLRFASPTRDLARLERVLRERLEKLALPSPVENLNLVAPQVEDLPGASGALFAGGAASDAMAQLLERLQARLGEERVQRIALRPDHRPECATVAGGAGDKLPPGLPPRPLWLLDHPQALAEVAGRPHWQGPLTLMAGPERLESGWWDQGEGGPGDLRRDYFVACTTDQRWAWIYRRLSLAGGWYLQGWFA